MKLSSFRELLLRKTQDDASLYALIKYAREEVILERVIEALEKMARARHKGDSANFAVRHFATEMDPETEPHMIRDAIGHHVSRYKAALGSNRNELANQHARQAFNLMNVADIASKHSGGKLSIDYVAPHPWERSKYTNQYDESHPLVQEGKYKKGDFTTKTKGLNYALKGKDFSFLQGAPHESYDYEIKRHGHNKAYPFEQIRVNGKYVPVDDVKDLKGYEEHPFDKHPIMNHFHENPSSRSPERDKQYADEHEKYYTQDPHIENFFNKHTELESADPEAYAKRGSEAAKPVHADIPGLDVSNAKEKVAAAPSSPKAEAVSAAKPGEEWKSVPQGVKLDQKQWDALDDKTKMALHEAFKGK
jgi:hypothetical protein